MNNEKYDEKIGDWLEPKKRIGKTLKVISDRFLSNA
tara:strand:+ start:149 stop:256 length:108 start_codon:yes stop_codon:yes gene_type:complete